MTLTVLNFTKCLVFGLLMSFAVPARSEYLGKMVGALGKVQHDVSGKVYAVDSRTIHIKGFTYDGTAPDAFFYAGRSGRPSDEGIIIPDENGSTKPLGLYTGKDVTLTLPEGVTLKDIKWISVWCRAFAIDFGSIMMPNNLQYPRPQKINALSTLDHDVSSDRIVVVDAQTFLIPNFSYDGTAPDAHFWVGLGSKPGPQGTKVPDENGSLTPLKKYSSKTIVITLPDHLTVFDIDYLSVWCEDFFADFGNVRIPANLNVPPSLKMLGVAPQTKLNCEVLYDGLALEVRWAVAGESIVMQLVGRVSDGEYMSFGLSGSQTSSVMVGGDVVTAWLERNTGKGFAQDYTLSAKAQCQGGGGACPDTETGGRNDVRLLNAALINDFTMLTFQRPLRASDNSDKTILTNGPQAVIWAVGPVNSQGHTSYHTLRTRGNMLVDFGRSPQWNCPLPDEDAAAVPQEKPTSTRVAAPKPNPSAWFIPPIPCHEPEDGVFYAQIGPTGGTNGYNAITGQVGWGIAYYINGLLIPEIHVVRGKTYTFVVEGGHDPENPSRSHPLYITDDPEGGYDHKTPAERNQVQVFAGVSLDQSGNPIPTAYGRLCEWKQDPNQPANSFNSFGAYQRSLNLKCEEGQPGVLQWTPDFNTPDTVYYHCYTHRHLGWKIHVHDSCSTAPQTLAVDEDYYYYDDQPPVGVNRRSALIDDDFGGIRRHYRTDDPESPDVETVQSTKDAQSEFSNFPFLMSVKGKKSFDESRGDPNWSSKKIDKVINNGFNIEQEFSSLPSLQSFEDNFNNFMSKNMNSEIGEDVKSIPKYHVESEMGSQKTKVYGNNRYAAEEVQQPQLLDYSQIFQNEAESNLRRNKEPKIRHTPTPTRISLPPSQMANSGELPRTKVQFGRNKNRRNDVPSLSSSGFNPASVVFESDFMPIMTHDSPGPPKLVRLERQNQPIGKLAKEANSPNSPFNIPSNMKTKLNVFGSNQFSQIQEKRKVVPSPVYQPNNWVESKNDAANLIAPNLAILPDEKKSKFSSEISKVEIQPLSSSNEIRPQTNFINNSPRIPIRNTHNVQINNIGESPNYRQIVVPPSQGASIKLGGNLQTNARGGSVFSDPVNKVVRKDANPFNVFTGKSTVPPPPFNVQGSSVSLKNDDRLSIIPGVAQEIPDDEQIHDFKKIAVAPDRNALNRLQERPPVPNLSSLPNQEPNRQRQQQRRRPNKPMNQQLKRQQNRPPIPQQNRPPNPQQNRPPIPQQNRPPIPQQNGRQQIKQTRQQNGRPIRQQNRQPTRQHNRRNGQPPQPNGRQPPPNWGERRNTPPTGREPPSNRPRQPMNARYPPRATPRRQGTLPINSPNSEKVGADEGSFLQSIWSSFTGRSSRDIPEELPEVEETTNEKT